MWEASPVERFIWVHTFDLEFWVVFKSLEKPVFFFMLHNIKKPGMNWLILFFYSSSSRAVRSLKESDCFGFTGWNVLVSAHARDFYCRRLTLTLIACAGNHWLNRVSLRGILKAHVSCRGDRRTGSVFCVRMRDKWVNGKMLCTRLQCCSYNITRSQRTREGLEMT